jgi:eukaryotic-like serine/threonine-protein kinase
MGSDEVPRAIGPYQIEETIATRAFTVTYRAAQVGLGRTVRIKTLKPTVAASSPYAAELSREAAILSRLEHESIVRLFDFVRAEGTARLVTEDPRGPTLEQVIASGPIAPDAAAAIALGISRALGHAHERGVIHRGLRPGVVVITRGSRIKLTDLSSAEILASPEDLAAAALRLPSAPDPLEGGESFARPDYMSPEQILGEPAGAASDVWSLGAVLHEMLAGARPFDGADRKAVAQRIRSGKPGPLPAGTPRELEQIVTRCLARAPDDRFEDARAVAEALESALALRTTLPVPVLVSRALFAAKLGDEITASAGVGAPAAAVSRGPDLLGAARVFGVAFLLILAGGFAIQVLRDSDTVPDPGTTQAMDGDDAGVAAVVGSRDRGMVRAIAQPWAEVYLDGEFVDVTPMGRPILVIPGKHFITFRHPKAPDEQRAIKIAAGQTVILDVTMRVERAADAGARDGAPDAAESP